MPFDLEKTIAVWRRPYEVNPTFSLEDIEELENSLRDRVESLISQGKTEEEAFGNAVKRTGSFSRAEKEYKKVYWGKLKRQQKLKDELILRFSMLKNYITIALRTLRKQKGYTFINIFGLAVGLTCFLLIGVYVRFELSYDTFHENADRIYRIAAEWPGQQIGNNHWAMTPGPLAEALMEEFPEVEYATRLTKANSLIEKNDAQFYEDGIFATEHFFDVFSFRLLQGDAHSVLADPLSIILTESLAQKYFGDINPIGQTLSVSHIGRDFKGKHEMQVTGIIEDVPANSHFTFGYVVPVSSAENLVPYLNRWGDAVFYTYTSLHSGYSLSEFTAKLPELAKKHLGQLGYFQRNPDEINVFYPQALTDIHLLSNINREFEANSDIKYIYLFAAVGLLILLIACINYVNLTTARSVTRTIEMGLRKVMGARRKQLIGQFMSEAVIPSVGALLVAVLFLLFLLPTLRALTASKITLDLNQNAGFLALAIGISLGVGIFAGSYPSLMMSSFHPVSMMKGMLSRRTIKTTHQNVLVVVQFTITIVLIIGTIVIQRQLDYIHNGNTGMDRDQVVSIDNKDNTLRERYAVLKQTLESHPDVLEVTAADDDPVYIGRRGSVSEWEEAEQGQSVQTYYSGTQFDYVEALGIELVEGRDLSLDFPADEDGSVLINETLKRQLGWETAAGKRFRFGTGDFNKYVQVVGVVKDFNFSSFHQEIAPVTLYIGPFTPNYSHLLVKARPGDMQETVSYLRDTMSEFSPGFPLEYHFLDEAYENMYQTEIRLGSLFSYFTALTLLVACLGLLGLASFAAFQRTKEIGVRKVLGASVSDILVLLSKDFLRLVLLAFILAAPIGYVATNRWLEDFAYRISLGVGTFLVAGIVVLLIAWITVSYQTLRAAQTNPIKTLKVE